MYIYRKILIIGCLLAPWLVQGAVQIDLPDTSGISGNSMEIPVYVLDDMTGLGIRAYQLQINYPANLLDFESADLTGTLTDDLDIFEFNQTAVNQVTLVAAGGTDLSGRGVLIKLNFTLKSSGTAALNFSDAANNFFNQGEPEMTLLNGRIVIGNPPTITVSPNTAVIGPDGQVNFTASGGQSPYIWSLTDPGIAEIVSTGNNTARLTATAPGLTQVIARDNNGIRDTTNGFIEIRPLSVSIPDTFVIQGQPIDVPVRISDVSNLTITSGSMKINFDANRLSVLEILKQGTLTEGYENMSARIESNAVSLAFAGTDPLSGSGDLIIVKFESAIENYGNTTISVSDMVFNENILGTVRNGTCSIQRLPQLSLNPNTATILTNETIQFSVTGTITPPLKWAANNPQVASMSDAGLLTALASGMTTVTVTDSVGATVTSGEIRIFDTRISLPDTTGIIGSTIDLPVKINPVPVGVPIYAIQGIFSFNTSALYFLDVLTNAAGLENWGFTVNQDGNDLHFAAAGATPVMAGGVLFELRLKILVGASVGQKQTLQIKELLLNEGSPAALTVSGSVISQLAGPPEIPLLISPVTGSLDVPPFGAKFCWGTTVGAQRYTIQISGDTEFTLPAFEVANITDTCVVIDSLGAEKNYYWRVRAVNSLGESDWSEVWPFATTISGLRAGEDHGYPAGFILQQNYPNPFNPGTIIEFSLPERGQTTLQIYNALGELLETLISRTLNAGTHRVYWDARGRPSGVYYCRVRSGDYIAGRRMLLIR